MIHQVSAVEGNTSGGSVMDAVVARRHSHTARWGLGTATALLLVVTILLISMFAHDGWNAPMVVMALGMVALTIASGLLTAASIWNTVRVKVIAGEVAVESGPIPWTRRRVISGAMIEQLYVQQAPLEKAFVPRLGGRFDVKARMRDGRWMTIVRGCRSEEDARRVEFAVEAALQREDEYGEVADDERSEVFADWRSALGPLPASISVRHEGDRVRIICRKPRFVVLKNAAVVGAAIGLSIVGLMQTQVNRAAVVVVGLIVAALIGRLVATWRWRSDLVIDSRQIERRRRGLFRWSEPLAVERSLVESLDCRSRTVVQRVGKSGSRRVRRFWLVGRNGGLGHFRLTEDFHSREDAFCVMNEVAQALGVDVQSTPFDE